MVDALTNAGIRVYPVTRDTAPDTVPEVDWVFFCAGNSAAYLSARDPQYCLQRNVIDLWKYLTMLRYNRWIHLSSVSVYPTGLNEKREDMTLDLRQLDLYGAHKLLAEKYVGEFAVDWIITRVGYLFGKGLKKNIFFDLWNGQNELFLTRNSVLAPLRADHLAQACITLADTAESGTYNVASAFSLSVPDIVSMKPGEYVFRDERHVDERGVNLDRLHRYWQQPENDTEYRGSIAAFLHNGP